jgi:hypothetical protein
LGCIVAKSLEKIINKKDKNFDRIYIYMMQYGINLPHKITSLNLPYGLIIVREQIQHKLAYFSFFQMLEKLFSICTEILIKSKV